MKKKTLTRKEPGVGDLVAANDKSNRNYGTTNKTNNFIGRIMSVSGAYASVQIIYCKNVGASSMTIPMNGLEKSCFDVIPEHTSKHKIGDSVVMDGPLSQCVKVPSMINSSYHYRQSIKGKVVRLAENGMLGVQFEVPVSVVPTGSDDSGWTSCHGMGVSGYCAYVHPHTAIIINDVLSGSIFLGDRLNMHVISRDYPMQGQKGIIRGMRSSDGYMAVEFPNADADTARRAGLHDCNGLINSAKGYYIHEGSLHETKVLEHTKRDTEYKQFICIVDNVVARRLPEKPVEIVTRIRDSYMGSKVYLIVQDGKYYMTQSLKKAVLEKVSPIKNIPHKMFESLTAMQNFLEKRQEVIFDHTPVRESSSFKSIPELLLVREEKEVKRPETFTVTAKENSGGKRKSLASMLTED